MVSPSSPIYPIQVVLNELMEPSRPSVVALKCFFPPPENGELQKFSRAGTGVFVGSRLILTSAHVVGTLSSVRDSARCSSLRNCSIGRTVAVTAKNKVLKTKVLAVDFAGDVAVLKAEGCGEADLPPPTAVAHSVASKELPLLVITSHEGCDGHGFVQLKVRATEDNSGRTQWPYGLEDGHGWARYGGLPSDDLKIVPGSPWFSLERKVVGIASRATGDETVDSIGGFVVPPARLRSVLNYAKMKAPHDRIVLNPWINAISFADDDNHDEEIESFGNVNAGFVMTMYLD